MNQEEYYKVTAKGGHVGKQYYIEIEIPINSSSGKEAARKARRCPRVKHDHKDAIIKVEKISKETYFEIIRKNKNDPCWKANSKQDQNKIRNLNERLILDPYYIENEKIDKQKRKEKVNYKMRKLDDINKLSFKEIKNVNEHENEIIKENINKNNNKVEKIKHENENFQLITENIKTNKKTTLEELHPDIFKKLDKSIKKNIIAAIKKFDYYDTHAHVNFSPICDYAEEIFNDCLNQSILINNIGTNEKDSLIAFKQAKKYENVFCTVGFHPEMFENYTPEQCSDYIEKILKQNDGNIIAIGESGLDYTCDVDKQKQKEVFIKMINLAKKYNLPLIIHVRDAHNDAIEILKQYAIGITKVIHCFTANADIAKKYLNIGCYISVTGIITFKKKVDDILKALKIIPLNKLLIETDCPFLTPEPYRGKENKPQYIKYVFNKVKEIHSIDENELIKQLQQNAIKFFEKN